MNHTSTYNIKEKCFTKDKILSIAKILYKEFTNQPKQNNSTIEFKIEFNDNTSYTKNDLSLFEENEIFDTKKIVKFEFTFDNKEETNKRYIKFDLTNKNHYISDLMIEGEKSWTVKLFDDIKAIIDSTKSQNTLIKNYFVNIIITFSFLLLSISILLIVIVLFQISGIELENKLLTVQEFILSSLLLPSIIASLFCALGMQGLIKKFFPNIEFSFGPEHLTNEKNKILVLGTIFSIIILASVVPFSIGTLSSMFF